MRQQNIEKAYLYGEMLRRKLSKNKILVVKKNDLTKEEAYEINVEIFQRLIEQRDAIVGAIENMIQPLIRNVGGVNIELQRQKERIEYLENQVNELQEMFSSVYGKIPKMPRLPGGKKRWSRTLKEAAYEIIKHYEEDCKAEVRIYEHLRHASDDFFEQHIFIFKKDLTNDMLYENVKKANVVRGITGNRGE